MTSYPSEPPDTLCPDSDVHTVSSPPGQRDNPSVCTPMSYQRFGIASDTNFLVLLYTELLIALQIFTLDKDNYKPGFPQSSPRIELFRGSPKIVSHKLLLDLHNLFIFLFTMKIRLSDARVHTLTYSLLIYSHSDTFILTRMLLPIDTLTLPL